MVTCLCGGAAAALALYLVAALTALPAPVSAVHWYLEYDREECVSAWVPQGQWNLIMQSVAAAGELPTTDVKTAEMEVQVETGVLGAGSGSGKRVISWEDAVSVMLGDSSKGFVITPRKKTELTDKICSAIRKVDVDGVMRLDHGDAYFASK